MLSAFALMCALSHWQCQYPDARRIATAIDAATDSEALRAHLVVFSFRESGWRVRPRPQSWDSRAGLARGPWQLWRGGDRSLVDQARGWLWIAQRGGLAGLCGSGPAAARMAVRRAREAERLLSLLQDDRGAVHP